MKGKRLLILGAAFALGLSACANSATIIKRNPLKAHNGEMVYKTTLFGSNYNSQSVGGYTTTWTATNGDFTVSLSNFNNNNNAWSYVKCGRKNTASVGTITTASAIDKAVTYVDVTVDAITAANVNSIKLYSSSNNSSWTEEGSFTKATGIQSVQVGSPASNLYYKVEFDCASGSANGLVTVSKLEYYVEDTSGLTKLATPAPQYDSENKRVTWVDIDNAKSYSVSVNGGEPITDVASPFDVSAFASPAGYTIEVTAIGDGVSYSDSDAGSVAFAFLTKAGTKEEPYDIANVKAAIDGNGPVSNVYAAGIISQIDSYYANGKAINYWISDDGETDNQIKIYGGKGLDGADFSSKDDIVVGASVVIVGNLVKYNDVYEFNSNSEQVLYQEPQRVLSSITLSGSYPTSFYKGDEFNFGAIVVTAHYNDNSTLDVTSHATFAGFDMDVAGNQTVTVSYTEDDVPATATYSISVTVPSVADSVEFVAGTDAGNETGTGTYTDIVRKDGVILTGTNTPLGNNDNYRIYKGKTLTVSIYSGSDKVIKSIVFECTANGTAKYGPGCFATQEGYSYNESTGTWVGESKSVSFTAESEQVRATSIVVTTGNVASAEEKVNEIKTRTTLSYNCEKTTNSSIVKDMLTRETTGITDGATNYGNWSNKVGTSGAVYAGNSAGSNNSIQLRSNNSNSGIVTTSSGGKALKVTVEWNSETVSNRTIDIYGKDSAYSAATDLYGNNQGTKIGSIVCGTSVELQIDDEYEFIGIRSNSGALYLDSVEIEWDGAVSSFTFSKATIRFGGLMQKALWDELDTDEHVIAGYGVMFATADAIGSGALKDATPNDTTIFDRNTALSETKLNPSLATAAQKAGLADADADYYIWNLCINITDEAYFKDSFIAVAYIQLKNGDKVFMKQTESYSVKTLAAKMIADGATDDGSLSYLAGL